MVIKKLYKELKYLSKTSNISGKDKIIVFHRHVKEKIRQAREEAERRYKGQSMYAFYMQKDTNKKIAEGNFVIEKDVIVLPKYNLRFFYDKKSFSHLVNVLHEIYVDRAYGGKETFKNREVVDLGGYVGESAIYFVRCGAKKVYAYEADKRLSQFASRNIKANKLSSKINFYNMFASGKPTHKKGKIGFDKIASMLKSNDAVLKMDIEGGERNILFESNPKSILKFKYIIMEYHYGYKDLADKLKSLGYRVGHHAPAGLMYIKERDDLMLLGYMVAARID